VHFSRFTARWYHLSSGEHFCSDCYELYYRGKTVGNSRNFGSLFANWKRHWQANSRYIEGTMRTFVADQILPYWVECTRPDCRKWRQLGRSVELTPEYISKFTCGVIFYTGKSIHRSSKACDIPEDSRAIHIRNDFASGGSWMSTLSFVPLLKTSPAALFLYEYYPDGVGLSPSCELCKSTDEENRERHTNLLNGSPNKSQSPRSARASSSVARKSFVSVKIRRSQTKKGIASRSRATSANRSSHPYLETSPIKHLGGRVTTAITPIGVGSHLQPFYQPFESQKARAIRPDVMEPWELEAFPQYERMQYLYLGLRNTVIALWTLGPNQWLTLQEICKHVIIRGLVRIFSLQAVRQILYFLTIKSFVNVGILMKPGAGFLPPKFNRHKVIVIGAGKFHDQADNVKK
jgi:lysine-specific histone demethylase 1B